MRVQKVERPLEPSMVTRPLTNDVNEGSERASLATGIGPVSSTLPLETEVHVGMKRIDGDNRAVNCSSACEPRRQAT
jgi:hypothetical protein